jgi:hypothetical protein
MVLGSASARARALRAALGERRRHFSGASDRYPGAGLLDHR